MKELTIEEKAQRYDEAINIAKKFYTPDSNNVNLKATLEMIFPELKESEDERILKQLRDFFKNHINSVYEEIGDNNAVLAWLEKQGEQKHAAEEVLIKAGLKPYKDGDQWCILLGDNIQEGICGFGNTIEDALYTFLKDLIASQNKQKPTEWSKKDEQNYDIILKIICRSNKSENLVNELFDWFKSLKSRVQPHSKQEWNEEDEKIISEVIQNYESGFLPSFIGRDRIIKGLKSIKDRVQPQPKQEWSEEDDQYLLVCKNALAKYQTTDKWDAYIISHWLEDKLKSLRPHSQWKPSDEQITWLYRAVDEASKDSRMKQILNELLSDLKKLRKE